MKVTVKKLADLKRPERNTRMHTDKQIAEFKRSVEMFGQIRPIVVDEDGVILAGNGLYETLLALGRETADCYIVKGLSENEKKKLMLADNRIFDLGVDDMKVFDEFIAELGDDLDVPGFDDELLRSLSADVAEIDTVMSEYGLIDDDRKEKMQAAHEEYEREAGQDHEEAEAENASENDSDRADRSARSVVCPKCGEVIWL